MRFCLAFQPHSTNLFRPVFMLAIKIHARRLNYTLAGRVHAQLSHSFPRILNYKYPKLKYIIVYINIRIVLNKFFLLSKIRSNGEKYFEKSRNFLFFSSSYLRGHTSSKPTFSRNSFTRPIREQQMRNLTVHKTAR